MKKVVLLLSVIGLLGCDELAQANNFPHKNQVVATSVRVIDGDTIEILTKDSPSMRVRLQGIDAPEKRQAFGKKATQSLKDCLTGNITVGYDETDRYGRLVGVAYSGNTDCNLNQIKQGMAWHYKAYQKQQPPAYRSIYADAEVVARKAKKGLWADKCPVAPWHFRKKQEVCDLPEF